MITQTDPTRLAPTSRPPGPHGRFPGEVLLRLRADILGYLTRICGQYGDSIYFRAGGRDFYVFNHPDLIRDVLVTRDDSFIKGPALQRAKRDAGRRASHQRRGVSSPPASACPAGVSS